MELVIIDDPVRVRTPEEQAAFEQFAERYHRWYYFPYVIEPAARRYLLEQAERYDVGGAE